MPADSLATVCQQVWRQQSMAVCGTDLYLETCWTPFTLTPRYPFFSPVSVVLHPVVPTYTWEPAQYCALWCRYPFLFSVCLSVTHCGADLLMASTMYCALYGLMTTLWPLCRHFTVCLSYFTVFLWGIFHMVSLHQGTNQLFQIKTPDPKWLTPCLDGISTEPVLPCVL